MRGPSSGHSHLRQAGVPDFELTICSTRRVRVSSLPVACQCLTSLGSSSTEHWCFLLAVCASVSFNSSSTLCCGEQHLHIMATGLAVREILANAPQLGTAGVKPQLPVEFCDWNFCPLCVVVLSPAPGRCREGSGTCVEHFWLFQSLGTWERPLSLKGLGRLDGR